jgi:hypothetical protein
MIIPTLVLAFGGMINAPPATPSPASPHRESVAITTATKLIARFTGIAWRSA